MASLEKTVKLILAGENQLGTMFYTAGHQIDALSSQLGNLNSSVTQVTDPFATLAGGVLKADAALAALAGGGLVYAFAKSKDFESASIELQKVLGDHPAALAEAEKYAKMLSGTYGEASTDILRSTANFKQAGFDIQESMTLTKAALDLVIAGDLDAASASDLLIASLKGFKAPATDAGRLIDILNEVSNNYATDVEQLAIGMAELSPIASTMGFSLEETAGVLTPVIEIFRSGGEAAVALKTGLLRLVDDSKPVKDALASIGVAQTDANGKLRSGKDILADVAQAFTHLDQNQKLFVAQQLVGIQQSARMVTVFDNLSKTSEITAVAMGAAGSAALEVASRLKSSEVAADRFVQAWVNSFTTMGDQFRDAAKDAINGGTQVLNALDAAVSTGAFDPLFAALDEQLGRLGAFLTQIAENIPAAFGSLDFSTLLAALKDLGLEVEGLFDGLDLATPEGLAVVLQRVVDGVAGLTNVTSGMVKGAAPFISALTDMVDGFIDIDAEGQKTLGTVTGFAGALNQLTRPVGAVIDALGGIGTGMQALAGVQVANLIAKLAGGASLTTAVSGVASGFGSLLATLSGPAGVIAVVGASTLAVNKAVENYLSWQDAEDELESSLKRGTEASAALAQKYRDISAATGVAVASTKDLKDAVAAGRLHFDETTKSWQAGAAPLRDFEAEVAAAAKSTYDWNEEIKRITDSNGNLIGAVDKAADALDGTKQSAIDAAAAYYELAGNTPEVARRMAELEGMDEPVKKTAEAAKEATDESEKMRLELLKLASDERIKTMEFSVDLQIERLKADADITKQILTNIGTAISSTGDLLGNLYDNFSAASNFTDKWFIQDQIQEEQRRREESFRLQKDLTEAEIDLARAKLDRMQSGESLINISMDGAEPAIELVLWNIVEKLQLRVNEEASEQLLGIA